MGEGWFDLVMKTYISTSEVTTLQHEVWNDTVELAALVAEALLAGAEGAEVLSGLRDDVVEELEVDAAGTRRVGLVCFGDLAVGVDLDGGAGPGDVYANISRRYVQQNG